MYGSGLRLFQVQGSGLMVWGSGFWVRALALRGDSSMSGRNIRLTGLGWVLPPLSNSWIIRII